MRFDEMMRCGAMSGKAAKPYNASHFNSCDDVTAFRGGLHNYKNIPLHHSLHFLYITATTTHKHLHQYLCLF